MCALWACICALDVATSDPYTFITITKNNGEVITDHGGTDPLTGWTQNSKHCYIFTCMDGTFTRACMDRSF